MRRHELIIEAHNSRRRERCAVCGATHTRGEPRIKGKRCRGQLAAHLRRPLQRAALLAPMFAGRNSAWQKLGDYEAVRWSEEAGAEG